MEMNMLSRNYSEVTAEPVGEGITIRWVIGKPEGAPNFATRVIEFQPGVVFDTHQHPFEHEIFVLEGEGVAEGSRLRNSPAGRQADRGQLEGSRRECRTRAQRGLSHRTNLPR